MPPLRVRRDRKLGRMLETMVEKQKANHETDSAKREELARSDSIPQNAVGTAYAAQYAPAGAARDALATTSPGYFAYDWSLNTQ